MRTITCMIVDDEPLAVRLLESFVDKTPGLQLLGSYTDSVEAMTALKGGGVDLLFLDIQMPDMNGMELAHMLPPETRVVFTTAFKEYAFESYEVSALDFLLKPIRYNKFIAAVEKARQWYGREPADDATKTDTIFIKVDGEYRQVPLSGILYVSGMKDYVMFWLEGEKRPLVTHLTMKAVEEMLPAAQFMRVHRSYVVALNKIRSIDRNDCIYIGDEIIRVTDAYRDAFLQFLSKKTRQ
jgi:DNA-binding LytR/AlgR family response regulator